MPSSPFNFPPFCASRLSVLYRFHKPAEVLRKYGPRLYKGTVAGSGVAASAAAPSAAEKKVTIAKSEHTVGKPFKVIATSQSATASAAEQGFKVPKPTSTQFGISLGWFLLCLCLRI